MKKAKPKKLTEEQLSRILGEHDAGQLCQGGGGAAWIQHTYTEDFSPRGCAGQVALNDYDILKIRSDFMYLFDENYDREMSPEQLLDLLKDARL